MEEIENYKKRLIFRSWHRGTREMDLIMGSFADLNVPHMDRAELEAYEELLNIPDPDMYDWIARRKPVPANLRTPLLDKLLDHDTSRCTAARNQDG